MAGGLEVGVPGQPRRQLLQAGHVDRVVEFLHHAQRGAVTGEPGQFGLEGEDLVGVTRGVALVLAKKDEHAGHVGAVLLEQFLLLRVVAEVVVAVGHAQPALEVEGDVHVGVLEVGEGADAEERVDGVAVQLAGDGQQGLDVMDGGDRREERLQWRGAGLLDGLFVHAGSVEIADALTVRVVPGIRRGLLEDLPHDLAIALGDHREAASPA